MGSLNYAVARRAGAKCLDAGAWIVACGNRCNGLAYFGPGRRDHRMCRRLDNQLCLVGSFAGKDVGQGRANMNLRIFGDPVVFSLGPFPVTETMVTSTIVAVVIVMVAVILRNFVRSQPSHWLSIVALMTVDSFDRLVEEIVGRRHAVVSTLAGSLFLFIASCNIAGQLPGVHPATGSLATTAALAVVVFLSVPIAGIRTNGLWTYIKHYFRPNPLLMPWHIISELSRTLALAVRLFGNIMSGHLVVGLLVSLAGFLVPTPIMALDLLIGLLQAYIFAILSTVYIGAAISAVEE